MAELKASEAWIDSIGKSADTNPQGLKTQEQYYADTEIQEHQHVLDTEDARDAERKYMKKLNLIVLPTISALYFFEYLDRGNIANAKLLGIDKGHDTLDNGVGPGTQELSSTQWQTVIMIFYVGLILFQVPGCIGYRIFPPSKWIAFGVCGWCAVCVLQTVALNWATLLVCRVFLGVFEGLFGTGIVYYLSIWYHRDELAFGGLIAFGIGHIQSNVQQWKLLFLIEGIPGFCLGLFCLYWLPDRPTKNSRFTGMMQKVALARYWRETTDQNPGISKKHFVLALTDWRLYVQAAIYVPTAALLSSISGFLPSIVRSLGYKATTSANLMTVPPYACAFALMYVTSWLSDRYRSRGIPIFILSCTAAVMYACLANLDNDHLSAKYGCMCIAVACVYATYPPSHAWAANNFGNETKRAVGMGAYTAMGNLGSIAGSFFYPSTDAPQYRKGHYLCFAMSIATAAITLANTMTLHRINRQRDQQYGTPQKGQSIDVSEDADANPMFRYMI
ncbi:uncharacterized protein A1O5_06465 [Cladophialophora psammophila CBS 110553]|uniref:Major facilitator superfamily (MFS) profile domain-containing protein n=1 Tax=Cladophialophora psammophila CBS 110553 TaxID=1182543 RepID=W9WQD9_9EURO|nr:uncharacterized protein A1O5_06465 [Cladophialophora psammophila CBS 110553]EXJ70397.1 hypothetical protein A1O5_06465 [Cladophialophora psammophila CBS 110553]